MTAIFFYIFIYFVGYYASNVLNMLTVRPLITNRYIAALFPVYGVALTHAYVMVNSPPPQGTDMTVEYALMAFIGLPVVVVTLGAAYLMWNSKGKDEDSSEAQLAREDDHSDDKSENEKKSDEMNTADTIEKKEEIQFESTEASSEKSTVASDKGKDNKET